MQVGRLTSALVRCPVDVAAGADGSGAWAMIELQGSIELDGETGANPAAGETMNNHALGALTFVDGVPTLEISNFRLEGKVVQVNKPLAVLQRAAKSGGDAEPARAGAEAAFDVVGVVRHKLLFKTRPKPLVGKRAKLCEEPTVAHVP